MVFKFLCCVLYYFSFSAEIPDRSVAGYIFLAMLGMLVKSAALPQGFLLDLPNKNSSSSDKSFLFGVSVNEYNLMDLSGSKTLYN
jgi:hypothetical protein